MQRSNPRILASLCFASLLAACSSSATSPDLTPAGDIGPRDAAREGAPTDGTPADGAESVDWVLRFDRATPGRTLSPALLGQYDLSGTLFSYDKVPGLIGAMKAAGMAEWRVGVGRWEITTRLLPMLTDGSSCAPQLAVFPPEARAPAGQTDFDLIASRDWFNYTDGSKVTAPMTQDDARYALGYLRSTIDLATAFGAAPYVNIDLMPRALSAGKVPLRVPNTVFEACYATFTNGISNAKPEDPAIFAAAATGLVKRIVEGSGSEPGRPVTHFELWNEPEYPHFWDKRFEPKGGLDEFFAMIGTSLVYLDAYRQASALPAVKQLRFGFGSFALADTAATAITAFSQAAASGTKVPFDFVSFHGYDDDPLKIVAQIEKAVTARAASTSYKDIELVLAEWGTLLENSTLDPMTMDVALHAATTLALGATLGLDRAHRAIIWDFYAGVPFGLVAHDGQLKPLHRAYTLLADVIGAGRALLSAKGLERGSLDGGLGTFIATVDPTSKAVRVMLINRGDQPRRVRIELENQTPTPTSIVIFDDPKSAPRSVTPSALLTLPSRALAVVHFD